MVLALYVPHAGGSDPEKVFRSESAHFSLRYPSSWSILTGDPNMLDIVNFQPGQRVRGVILPPRGASISVHKKPEDIPTQEKWIETISAHSEYSRREIDGSAAPDGCKRLVEVRWHWDAGGAPEVYFQETAYYCFSKAGFYRIQLTYRSDNPSGPELTGLALKVARSFRAW
jgi:hypothetical protein